VCLGFHTLCVQRNATARPPSVVLSSPSVCDIMDRCRRSRTQLLVFAAAASASATDKHCQTCELRVPTTTIVTTSARRNPPLLSPVVSLSASLCVCQRICTATASAAQLSYNRQLDKHCQTCQFNHNIRLIMSSSSSSSVATPFPFFSTLRQSLCLCICLH
jgi:hypothetical protein